MCRTNATCFSRLQCLHAWWKHNMHSSLLARMLRLFVTGKLYTSDALCSALGQRTSADEHWISLFSIYPTAHLGAGMCSLLAACMRLRVVCVCVCFLSARFRETTPSSRISFCAQNPRETLRFSLAHYSTFSRVHCMQTFLNFEHKTVAQRMCCADACFGVSHDRNTSVGPCFICNILRK